MWVLLGSFFMFSNDWSYTTKSVLQLAKLRWKICENQIENRASPDLVMIIGSACLLMFLLDT